MKLIIKKEFYWNEHKWEWIDSRTLPYHSCRYETRNTNEFVEKGFYKSNFFSFSNIFSFQTICFGMQ